MAERKPVDLRSDTVTRPSAAMHEAIAAAEVGDDVFGDDPTVRGLEERVARLLDKEAALFVPSGTMANQLALRAHTRWGDEVLLHARSHIFNYESGGAAAISGVTCRPIDSDDGTLPLEFLRAKIHQTEDPHYAPTTLICVENTHNSCGGRVVPTAHLRAVTQLAKDYGLSTHFDGARIWNAAVATGESLPDLAEGFDSLSVCFSKGLGAPVGSALVGTEEFIRRAYRFRKMFGGAMRQSGLLAAGALYALEHNLERLKEDHRRATLLATELSTLPGVVIDAAEVETNLVYFEIQEGHRLLDIPGGLLAALEERGVLITGGGRRYRAALHLDIDEEQLERGLDVFRDIFK